MGVTRPILVVTAAGHEWGMGHAVRTSALVAAMGAATRVRVLAVGAEVPLRASFPAARLSVTTEGGLERELAAETPALAVVDLPPRIARPWAALRRLGAPVAAVEDFGGEVDADVVFNGSVVECHHLFRGPSHLQVYAGGSYALIRPDFAAHPWVPPAERVLTVVAGGGDSARDWVFALAEGGLDATRHGPVTLVVGAAFPERERLERCCRAAGFTLLSGLPATRLAARMAASSAVLVTGGMVAYEAAAVGVPAVINPLLDDMREEIAAFAAAGAALDLQGGGMDMARIDAALSSLMDNRERAHTMSQRQRTLVDGRGLARCAAILDSLLERP